MSAQRVVDILLGEADIDFDPGEMAGQLYQKSRREKIRSWYRDFVKVQQDANYWKTLLSNADIEPRDMAEVVLFTSRTLNAVLDGVVSRKEAVDGLFRAFSRDGVRIGGKGIDTITSIFLVASLHAREVPEVKDEPMPDHVKKQMLAKLKALRDARGGAA